MKNLISTSYGTFRATFSDRGLCSLEFPGTFPESESSDEAPSPFFERTVQGLRSFLAGVAPAETPTIDLADQGTAFQRAVWEQLLSIPWGQTTTYGELALRLGKKGSARAVGASCGANPIPVFIPCHRVLGAGSNLTGFSGGLEWKRRLLALEAPGLFSSLKAA
jgi:O-6-methylguanine DNA methyltransferase